MTPLSEVTELHRNAQRSQDSRVAITAVLVNVAGFLPALFVSTLAVRVERDISLDTSGLGVAVGLHFALAALASGSSGRLADRFGWPRAAALACICSSVSLAGIGLIAHSYPALVGFLMIGGLGLSFALPSGNLALVQNVSVRYHGLTFGAKQAAAPAASFAAAVCLPLLAVTLGWRWAFGAAACIPLVTLTRVIREGHRTRFAVPGPHDGRPRSLVRFPLRIVAAGAGLATLAVGSIGTFFVLWMTHEGWSHSSAGGIAALASGIGVVVRASAGWVADRRGYDALRLVSIFLGIGAAGLVGLALGVDVLIPLLAILTYAALWGWSGLFHYGVAGRHRDAAGEATGIAQAGLAAGMAVGSLIFGAIAESYGYSAAWLVSAVCALLGACLIATGAHLLGHDSVREVVDVPNL